jgi:FMN reductase
MTGAGPGHSLGSNNTLVPLLFELGAAVPVRGLYFDTNAMDQVEQQINNLSAEVASALKSLVTAVAGVQGRQEK